MIKSVSRFLNVVDDATLSLSEYSRFNIFDTPSNIADIIAQHYKSELFLQITKIFGQISLNLSATVGLAITVGKSLFQKKIDYSPRLPRYIDHSSVLTCFSERDALGGMIAQKSNINDDSYMWCSRVNRGDDLFVLFIRQILIVDCIK